MQFLAVGIRNVRGALSKEAEVHLKMFMGSSSL